MASFWMLFITILETRISSTTPPLPLAVLSRMPRSVPSKTQFEIVTFFIPPDTSLPITTPPCPLSIVQLVIVTFSVGVAHLRPSASRPDLMVIQSSPTLIWQSEICTFLHEVGLMPSVLGDGGLKIVTPVIRILSQKAGLIVQNGLFLMVIPSMRMFSDWNA